MKVLYIDTAITGHHQAYMKELTQNNSLQTSVIALPEAIEGLNNAKQYVYSPINMVQKKLFPFVKWMKELLVVAEAERVDIVHFLTGDVFYKFFGIGLWRFRKFKTVMTLHWVRAGKLRHLSMQMFCRKVDKVIVHSSYLLKELQMMGIHNGDHIEYPQFKGVKKISKEEARRYWGITLDGPVILSLGGTRSDKGVDILIEALKSVKQPFQLLIAGKSETFDEAYITEHTKAYSECVKTALRFLTDEEVELAVAACDIVALPYRYSFNGASGPLGEGVCRDKCIVGANHGNLGYTIRENHLGYTFETENVEDLAGVLNKALGEAFVVDEVYAEYKASLDPKLFVESYKKLYEDLLK